LIQVEQVTVYYEGVCALSDVSLKADQGEIIALIGANGAGKTTLLNLISGVVRPRTGRILFKEADITALAPDKIVDLGISQVPEGRHLFGPLTVKENLELGAYKLRKQKASDDLAHDFDAVFKLFPVLKRRLAQKAGTLSGGEQQMLAIARGLMGRPALLLLDEPSLGLAPLLVQEILAAIRQLNDQGTTILLVEQNARAALRISDRAYVLETGNVRLQGRTAELLENEAVKQAYLGQEAWRECR
jgi:branched-chain amino acid transport system ATP-binding protein